MIFKSLVCAFAMACMCVSYFIGGTVGGLLVDYDTAVPWRGFPSICTG